MFKVINSKTKRVLGVYDTRLAAIFKVLHLYSEDETFYMDYDSKYEVVEV